MQATNPHFLLYSETGTAAGARPNWRFLLHPVDGGEFLVAADAEPGACGNRLELLAVVRGLEALDQPSRVTLLTRSRYVSRGIRRGLSQWRERKWQWERFGKLVPIRNQDLWQRVDRALEFHQVQCCPSPFDQDTNDSFDAAEAAGDCEMLAAPTANAASLPVTTPVATPAPQLGRRPVMRQAVAERPRRRRFSRTFNRLRHGVLAPLAAFWRPAFTRAA